MENINISLGIELDKKQFNEGYIQNEVSKAASDVTVKVNNVKIGDVSRELQNDINRQIGNIEVKIENTSIDKSQINNIIEDFISNINDELSRSGHILIGEDGVSLDNKALQNKLSKSIRTSMQNAVESIEIDYGKISTVGSKKVAEQINQELSKINVDEVKSDLSSIRSEIKVEDGSLESAKESIRELYAEVKALELELSDLSILDDRDLSFVGDVLDEYSRRLDDIKYKKYELEDVNIELVDTKELANFEVYYASVADMLDVMIEKASTFSSKVSDLDTNQNLEVDVIPNVKDFDIQDERVDITPNIKDFNIEDESINVVPNVKEFEIQDQSIDITPNVKEFNVDDREINITPNIKEFDIDDESINITPNVKEFDVEDRSIYVTPEVKDFEVEDKNINVTPNVKDFSVEDKNIDVVPTVKDFDIEDKAVNITPNVKDFSVDDQSIEITPSIKDFNIEDRDVNITPTIKDFDIDDKNINVTPNVKDFNIEDREVNINPNVKDFSVEDKNIDVTANLKDFTWEDSQINELNKDVNDTLAEPKIFRIDVDFNDNQIDSLISQILSEKSAVLNDLAQKYGLDFSEQFKNVIIDRLSNADLVVYDDIMMSYRGDKSGELFDDIEKLQDRLVELSSEAYALDILFTYDENIFNNLNERINSFKDRLSEIPVGNEIELFDFTKATEEIQKIKDNIDFLQSDYDSYGGIVNIEEFTYLRSELENIGILINNISNPNIEGVKEVNRLYDEIAEKIYSLDDGFTSDPMFDEYVTDAEHLRNVISNLTGTMNSFTIELNSMMGSGEVQSDLTKYYDTLSSVKYLLDSFTNGDKVLENYTVNELNREYQRYYELLSNVNRVASSIETPKMDFEDINFDSITDSIDNLEDKLDIKISNIEIPDRDVIYEKLQGVLDSVSRELTAYVGNVDYNGDLNNFKETINNTLNSIDNFINIPFTLDLQEDNVGNIRNSIENLVIGIQGILDKSKQTFRMSAKYLEEVFGESINRVSEQFSKMLSREIVFDFENVRFEGLESKVSEISSKLSNGIVITPEVKIPEPNTYNVENNVNIGRLNVGNEEVSVAITPELDLEIFEQQISYLKEFATKYGIEFSDEFMREIIDGIKSGDISSALQTIENQVKETVSNLYTDESKDAGRRLLTNLNDYIREFKALLGGSRINIADILLSDEEVSDLKNKLGRVFTLTEDGGKQLGRSISELKNLSDSFGFEFDESILQNTIKQLADIVNLRRQLKNDPISIPIEYVNIGFSENQHLQELDKDLSLIQTDLMNIENLARNLGEEFKFDIEVNPVKDLIDENSINSSINSSKELQARLNEIKETATEVSSIKYKFDENGDLLRALITYKDEIGRTVNELAGYELNPFTGELDFQTKLVSAAEKFIDVTNEVKKLSEELDKLQGRAFLDESVISDVRNQIDSINGDNARESIDRLYGEIKRLGSAESEINKIVNSIKSVEDEVSKIYSNNISLFKDENIQSDIDLVNDIIARLRNFKSDLESGSNVELLDVKSSIQELNIARDILKDTILSQNKINQLTEKQTELRRRLAGLAGLIDSSEIDRISKAIDDIKVDNLNSDFKAINNTIKSFSKSETQLTRVSKVINDIQNKMSNLNSDNVRLFESGNFDSEISKVVDSLENLISVRERLEAGELINKNNITSEINYLNNAYKNLNSTIETVISNGSKVNDLQTRLSKSIQTRITLDADTTYVNELVNSLNNIDITSEDASLQIAELSNQITSLGKADAHILKVQDTISKLNNELNKFESVEGIGKIVDDSDIKRVSSMESELEKLSSVLRKIENGANYTREEIQRMCNDGINSMRDLSDSAVDVGDVFSGLGGALNRGLEVALGFEFVELFKNQVSQVKEEIIKLDNEMVSLRRVSSETEATYESIAKSANATGVEMGKTTQEVIFATTEFVKMGYSINEATNSLSKAGLTLSNVAEMDISASVDAIVSTMKGMRLSAEEANTIVDIINEAGNSFALSSSDLAEGLRIGAASLSIAGNDLVEASSLITAGTEVLQSPEKVIK